MNNVGEIPPFPTFVEVLVLTTKAGEYDKSNKNRKNLLLEQRWWLWFQAEILLETTYAGPVPLFTTTIMDNLGVLSIKESWCNVA